MYKHTASSRNMYTVIKISTKSDSLVTKPPWLTEEGLILTRDDKACKKKYKTNYQFKSH